MVGAFQVTLPLPPPNVVFSQTAPLTLAVLPLIHSSLLSQLGGTFGRVPLLCPLGTRTRSFPAVLFPEQATCHCEVCPGPICSCFFDDAKTVSGSAFRLTHDADSGRPHRPHARAPLDKRYDVRVPSPMAHLVALHGCRILANMACDGEQVKVESGTAYCTSAFICSRL